MRVCFTRISYYSELNGLDWFFVLHLIVSMVFLCRLYVNEVSNWIVAWKTFNIYLFMWLKIYIIFFCTYLSLVFLPAFFLYGNFLMHIAYWLLNTDCVWNFDIWKGLRIWSYLDFFSVLLWMKLCRLVCGYKEYILEFYLIFNDNILGKIRICFKDNLMMCILYIYNIYWYKLLLLNFSGRIYLISVIQSKHAIFQILYCVIHAQNKIFWNIWNTLESYYYSWENFWRCQCEI